MTDTNKMNTKDIAIRSHDIVVCLERSSVPDFDILTLLGMSVRLALHLRGVQAISFYTVQQVAIYLLDFPTAAVKPVLHFLAEAEFVRLDTQGHTIRTVFPEVPFYEDLFSDLGEVANDSGFSEAEWLTLLLVNKLSDSPMLVEHVSQFGADKKLASRVIDIGSQGDFLLTHRARGRSILISPTYFPENASAYADLVAGSNANRVKKVLSLLKSNQGWPIKKIIEDKEIAGVNLDNEDIVLLAKLAGEGFISPPAIETNHAGTNHFLFGPRPDNTRLEPIKRPIYEAAMALVASVRQGQLLPEKYAIRYPRRILTSFKERGYIGANSEAIQQYRQVAALGVGRLEPTSPGKSQLTLIDRPENIEALDMAISMIDGLEPPVIPTEEITIALRQGDKFVDSLIGRKRLITDKVVDLDEESREAIDDFILRGRA